MLEQLRRDFVGGLTQAFRELCSELLPEHELALEYRPGWSDGKSLMEVLDEGLVQDRRLAHTRAGPHRAELRVTVGSILAAGTVSRGEQKLIAAALVLAQARTLAEHRGIRCVILVDDLPSELDGCSRGRLLDALGRTPSQRWFTSIEPMAVPMSDAGTFSRYTIEAGKVSSMVY